MRNRKKAVRHIAMICCLHQWYRKQLQKDKNGMWAMNAFEGLVLLQKTQMYLLHCQPGFLQIFIAQLLLVAYT